MITASCHCGAINVEIDEKEKDSRIAVNARTMRPEDVSGIPVRTFDGASTWEYLEE